MSETAFAERAVEAAAVKALSARLERGWQVIEEARQAGNRREADRLERHWLRLLEEYERRADALWEVI